MTALLDGLRAAIDARLAESMAAGPVALVNFPNHANAGDDAIWLGAEESLRRLGRNVGYRASWASYDPAALRRSVPYGPILLNGGGNLGDVYQRQQAVRERVLRDFPGRSVVQLPQSIWYRDPAWPDTFRALVEAHGSFTLLVREEDSLRLAPQLGATALALCPDLALGLPPRPRDGAPVVDIVWCPQHQAESRGAPPTAADVEVLDWLGHFPDERAPGRQVGVAERIEERVVRSPLAAARFPVAVGQSYTVLGEHYVARAMAALGRGRVVVTERLHGHVFCLLLGIPHVLLDSVNGKVGALHRTWTAGSDLVHPAADVDEALELARSLVVAS